MDDTSVNQLEISMEDFLEHYGVPGMKWGRRKSSQDHKTYATLRKKKTRELSDAELRTMLNRMNMEQQTRRMNPSKMKKGLAFVGAALATGELMNKAINFSKTPAGRAIADKLSHLTPG